MLEGARAAGRRETNLREDCLTMATLVCNTDRAIVAENNLVEDGMRVRSPARRSRVSLGVTSWREGSRV